MKRRNPKRTIVYHLPSHPQQACGAARPAGLAVSVTIRVDEEASDAAIVESDARVKLLNPGSPVTVTTQVV